MGKCQLNYVKFAEFDLNHGRKITLGNRIGFVDQDDKGLIKINPRMRIGKIGVRVHGFFTRIFCQTVKIDAAESGKTKVKAIHLNKKSLVKWLNSQLPDTEKLKGKKSSKDIKDKLNSLSSTIKAEGFSVKTDKNGETLYPPSLNSSRISYKQIRSKLWRLFAKTTYRSWTALKLRFALGLSEKTMNTASKFLAIDTARRVSKNTPAYRQMVERKKEDKEITNFDHYPVTSKDNYIKPAIKEENELSLYVNGKLPKKTKRDTSTGTSGPSTPWYRGVSEQKHIEQMTTYAAKAILGNKRYNFINGFAMGPWATGVTATLAMSNNKSSSIAVIGPNIDEIYACMKEQARLFGKKHPIIVSGYPPHIRAVVEKAVKDGFPMHEYTLFAVVGGEAMSEDLRDLLVCQKNEAGDVLRTGFKQCYSSYGASDLDINIGYESDFEIELRKLCHLPENQALAEELFGKNEFKPMIFHYDPLNYHIESDEKRNLYYTCVRDDRISPRVRYNLGDIGKVTALSDVLATLKKHGISLKNKPNTNLPLLFVWGRAGAQISFRGCKVAPENLGEAILRLDADKRPGLNAKIAHYGFYQHVNESKQTITEIHLEMNEESDVDAADVKLLKDILDELQVVNSDLVAQIPNCPDAEKPSLRVFKKGESPMDRQQKLYPMRKKQYIFNAGDEFVPEHAAIENVGRLIPFQ